MANRNFHRVQSLTREVKHLFVRVSIGASGAPTLQSSDSVGVASISRTSAGLYKITLDDKYNKLLMVKMVHVSSTEEDLNSQVKAESVSVDKTIDLFTLTGAVATDPANGDVLLLEISLKNSSVVR
jgi:hypothetical protein